MKAILHHARVNRLTSFVALVLVSLGLLFLVSALAGPQVRLDSTRAVAAGRAPIYTTGSFTFAAPQQMPKAPVSPVFFQQDAEPEIKADLFGNIYITAINGVPGGTDLWKSIDQGATFTYLGQPDGLQDKCASPTPQCLAGGGADDSIDVSSGGYLYVTSLYIGSVTFSTSMDGGTGGTLPGQAWTVNPVSTGVPVEDRQWIAAYGPQTVFMTFRQAPGTGRLLFTKSTDAGKTFSPPTLLTSANSTEGNLVVDPYSGYLYTTFIPSAALNRIDLLKSTDGGATWSTITGVYTGPTGADPAHKFTLVAVDRGGNLHLTFSSKDANGTHVYLTSSPFDATLVNGKAKGPGEAGTWMAPVRIDSGASTNTAVQPWVVGGSPGVVDITWIGSSGANADTAPFDWQVYFAQVTNALSASPSVAQSQVTTNPVHDTNICFNGTGCTGTANRDLLEYYTMSLDPEGSALIAYADSVNNCPAASCKTNTWFSRQSSGTKAYAPPAGPAPATFAPNVAVGSPGAEPSLWVDSYNCVYVTAPGNPWVWKSVNAGASFL
ncbi:MAG: glycoside hydrolase, partial [Verrucomicrobiota bacterium]|nr:glycoside hydrolase [Verrucomicrobiota bacterium]